MRRGAEGRRVVAPPLNLKLPDPDDAMFVEVAVAGQADAIVTGHTGHFPPHPFRGLPVLLPAEFLAHHRRRSAGTDGG